MVYLSLARQSDLVIKIPEFIIVLFRHCIDRQYLLFILQFTILFGQQYVCLKLAWMIIPLFVQEYHHLKVDMLNISTLK